MPVVSTTLCYPNPAVPTQGVFIRRRLRAIHRLMAVEVVAPVPWFPMVAPMQSGATCGDAEEPPVWRPRMFYLPGVAKTLDGRFYARAFERGLARAMGGDRPALIEAHFVWPDGVGAWRVARKWGVPLICTIRGKLVSQIAEASKRRRIREMLVAADGLIAVSQSLADLAEEVAGRGLGVRVIPNGIDDGVFRRSESAEARAALGWPDGVKYVVSVGHLQALKGFHRLIEVWREVRRRLGDVRLVLVGGDVGEPGYVRRLLGQIEAAGLGLAIDGGRRGSSDDGPRGRAATPRRRHRFDRGNRLDTSRLCGRRCVSGAPWEGDGGSREAVVTMTGRVEPERVATMLNAADLFVLASRSEGWCNAIVEALACGCPVVATEVGGNREIVEDSALGRLVPFGDRAALTEAICSALGQAWDRDRIAVLGGRRDWQQVARECVDVFESVLGRRRGV